MTKHITVELTEDQINELISMIYVSTFTPWWKRLRLKLEKALAEAKNV